MQLEEMLKIMSTNMVAVGGARGIGRISNDKRKLRQAQELE